MPRYAYERLSHESAGLLEIESSRLFQHSGMIAVFEPGPLGRPDGGVDIADAIHLVTTLFPAGGGTGAALLCDDACDANDDGQLDLADAIAALDALFGSVPVPLPAPGPNCGFDPTDDLLECDVTSGC